MSHVVDHLLMQTLCVIHHAQTTKNTRFVLQILEAMTDPECLHEAVDCKVVLLEAQVNTAFEGRLHTPPGTILDVGCNWQPYACTHVEYGPCTGC